MIELTAITQEVTTNSNIIFDTNVIKSGCAERHRADSGLITLVGSGRYLVTFSGNVAVPTGGTAGEIDLAIAVNGEALNETVMKATPTALNAYFNVATQTYVDNCGKCCQNISVKNLTSQTIAVDHPTISIVRVNG